MVMVFAFLRSIHRYYALGAPLAGDSNLNVPILQRRVSARFQSGGRSIRIAAEPQRGSGSVMPESAFRLYGGALPLANRILATSSEQPTGFISQSLSDISFYPGR
jgi:hypothetical protein